MTKIENKVNEILGIETKPALETIVKIDNPSVPRIKGERNSLVTWVTGEQFK